MITPLTPEQAAQFSSLISGLSKDQITWISGYFAGLNAANSQSNHLAEKKQLPNEAPSAHQTELTILYGSRTGNGESIAKKAQKIAIQHGFSAVLKNMEDYKTRDLKSEKNLLVIVSTHGEGEPPFQAKEVHEFIHSKRAARLEGVNYSVLALGDRSYLKFCQTGIEFDSQLHELGANRIHPRVDCDTSFEEDANRWIEETLKAFGGSAVVPAHVISEPQSSASHTESGYNKKNPFNAPVLEKSKLHGRGSDRQTLHVELSLENSGLIYQPGDSAGILPTNAPELVNELIETLHLNAETIVNTGNAKVSLYEALFRYYEIANVTSDVISKYADLIGNKELKALTQDHAKLKEYVYGKDIVDLFQNYPSDIKAEQLIGILRKLQARLYSISSSPLVHPDEVHLTVGVVKYESTGRLRNGVCSTFFSDRISDNETVPIFIEQNPNFRLPEDNKTPIIMVGAGTGVAPYRSFVEHRQELGNSGKSWLFFGNRFFQSEFLYQLEWQSFLKEGSLSKLDVAFSRDGSEKSYVQHKILKNSKEVYQWLEEGGHFYVCGDMKKMANDVNEALITVVQKEGGRSRELAVEYVTALQKAKRYQTDVY